MSSQGWKNSCILRLSPKQYLNEATNAKPDGCRYDASYRYCIYHVVCE
jgi:hypothetical protein